MKLLAIETSCDESGVALFRLDSFLEGRSASECLEVELLSSQAKLHEAYGGVVPELAAREHVKNLPALLETLPLDDIAAVAVTRGPGLKGCLLVGISFAQAFGVARKIPVLGVHHLEGHIASAYYEQPEIEYPLLVLIVSGGHTALVSSAQFGQYELVAETRDDAAGEAFDKIATLLELPYPGGPNLAALAAAGDPTRFQFPRAVLADETSFSFSGLKTAVAREIQRMKGLPVEQRGDFAASVESAIVEQLVSKTVQAVTKYRPKSFLLTGGVAANRRLRARLGESFTDVQCIFPKPSLCTDNAAMIAAAAAVRIRGDRSILTSDSSPLSVLPRWPLTER